MKYFEKRWPIILILVLGFIYIIIINNNVKKYEQMEINNIEQLKKYCEMYNGDIENVNIDSDSCSTIMSDKNNLTRNNFYVRFFDILLNDIRFLNVFSCLILFIVSIYGFNIYFKSGFIIQILKREKKNRFVFRIMKMMYRYVWLFPLFMLLIFLICSYKASFDPQVLIDSGMSWGDIMKNVPLFISLYICNIFLYSIFYLNIALIVVRKQHNYLLAVIESFLVILGIELFMEILINGFIFGTILNEYDSGLIFNILNLFNFNILEYNYGINGYFLFVMSCVLISFIGVIISYFSKEKFIIDCEKNFMEEI